MVLQALELRLITEIFMYSVPYSRFSQASTMRRQLLRQRHRFLADNRFAFSRRSQNQFLVGFGICYNVDNVKFRFAKKLVYGFVYIGYIKRFAVSVRLSVLFQTAVTLHPIFSQAAI